MKPSIIPPLSFVNTDENHSHLRPEIDDFLLINNPLTSGGVK
jgi:hypothetical protein